MKSVVVTTVTLIGVLALTVAAALGAEDGAGTYKKRCAGCHGANGEGKPAMKAPALKGTALDAAKITDHLMKGEPESKPPHNKGITGMTQPQAEAVAAYVKSLK